VRAGEAKKQRRRDPAASLETNHRDREHLALSAPRQTTKRAARAGTGGSSAFDFAGAAARLTDAAARAGAAIMRHYHEGPRVKLKEDQSPVTLADHASEAIILGALKSFAPGIPVVSEETACDRSAELGPRFFLVDPLDGTKEFIEKRSDFTINIALIENGAPRFGLVYAPARAVLALTLKDDSAVETKLEPGEDGAELAKLDLSPLHTREPKPEGLVAVASRSHLDVATEEFLSKLKLAGCSNAGSALKFLLVARGEADIYPRFGPTMEWDTAAGHAVLNAAGGHVVDKDGAPLRYGKSGTGLRNPGFVAWGKAPHGRA
jgi:3'(2'), 5'-bisphosphate nucleotidase